MKPWLCPISSFTIRPVETAPRRSAGRGCTTARPYATCRTARLDDCTTVLPARFSPTPAAAEPAAAAPHLGTGLVDGEVSAAHLRSVQRGDRLLRLLIGAHFDE